MVNSLQPHDPSPALVQGADREPSFHIRRGAMAELVWNRSQFRPSRIAPQFIILAMAGGIAYRF
jgi:hypothetical protein